MKNYKEPIINRLTKLGYTKIRVCKEKIDVLSWNKPSLASFLHLQSSNTLTEILHMGLIGLTESLTRVHKRGPMAGKIFLFHPSLLLSSLIQAVVHGVVMYHTIAIAIVFHAPLLPNLPPPPPIQILPHLTQYQLRFFIIPKTRSWNPISKV